MSRARAWWGAVAAAIAVLVSPPAGALTPASDVCTLGNITQVNFTDADTTAGRTAHYDPELSNTCPMAGGGVMYPQSGDGPDLVYGLRPYADTMVTVTMTPGPETDLALYVISSTCTVGVVSVNCVVGDDSGGQGIAEAVTVAVTKDVSYYVVVDGFSGSSGPFSLSVSGLLSPLDIDGNGQVDPLKDGLLSLRYHFGFTGATLVTDAVAENCTRCSASSIEFYLASLRQTL